MRLCEISIRGRYVAYVAYMQVCDQGTKANAGKQTGPAKGPGAEAGEQRGQRVRGVGIHTIIKNRICRYPGRGLTLDTWARDEVV